MLRRLLCAFVLLSGVAGQAGDKVGNGGGLWTCSVNGNLMASHLVDLYEAKEELGLDPVITVEADPMKIVQERSDFVRLNLPEYSPTWNKVLSETRGKIRFVNSDLIVVEDALYRLKPAAMTCPEPWAYTQFANYTNLDQVLVRADLWQSLQVSSLHKAALIWHEVIYRWLRDTEKDQDSVRARQIVGILFSTLSPGEMSAAILKILNQGDPVPAPPPPAPVPVPIQWMCMVENKHISMVYAGYGMTRLEAETLTSQTCQNAGQQGFFCSTQVNCQELTDIFPVHSCRTENKHIGKAYLGTGRSRLEAEYKAREACQQSDQRFFCEPQVTCN
jgi:hypothetical protein